MGNLVCLCVLSSAANIQGDQKSCGPIRNKVCCLGGVSIPPLFKGASQLQCFSVEREGGERWERKNNDGWCLCVSEPESAAVCEAGAQRSPVRQTVPAGKMGHTGRPEHCVCSSLQHYYSITTESPCSSAPQQLISADKRVWSGITPPSGEGERCSSHPSAHPEVCEGDRSARTQSTDGHLSLIPSFAME